MKFRYILTAVLASVAFLAGAKTESDPMYMVLTMRSGELKAVNIDDVSRLTFNGGNMTVDKKDSTCEQINLSDVSNMEFSNNEEGGVENVRDNSSVISFDATKGAVSFFGESGKVFSIYDVNGNLILSYATKAGMQSIDITALPAGIFIVSYNGQSLKILK